MACGGSICLGLGTSSSSSRWSMSCLISALLPVSSCYKPPPPLLHVQTQPTLTPSSATTRLTITRRRRPLSIPSSFHGLAPLHSLLSLNSPDSNSFENCFTIIGNGGRISAMRHGRRVPKLNRPPDQRKALLRGLTTQLLKYGRIKTTRARASAMRKYVDKMITMAKDGSLHKRRQALGYIYEKQIVHALFAEVPERYGERNGGYTRIIRTLPRRGDNAPMAYIELV